MRKSSRPGVRALLAILSTLLVSQCTCKNNRMDDPTEATAPPAAPEATTPAEGVPKPTQVKPMPAALDTRDLDGDEKEIVAGVLTEQYDPCGKPRSFYESLEDPETCAAAGELGAMVVDLASKGLNQRQITRAYLEEVARRARKVALALEGRPVYGDPATAKHVMVKFTDFQCPFCKEASQPAKDLAKKYDAVLYAKMLPLDMHETARPLALAALAAHKQGKFWEAYEAFFDNQARLHADPPPIREVLKEAGIDMARFDEDIKDPALETMLAEDMAESDRYKLKGTPTFFVDGYEVEYSNLEDALQAPARE